MALPLHARLLELERGAAPAADLETTCQAISRLHQNSEAWSQWIWSDDLKILPLQLEFEGALCVQVDSRFRECFINPVAIVCLDMI